MSRRITSARATVEAGCYGSLGCGLTSGVLLRDCRLGWFRVRRDLDEGVVKL